MTCKNETARLALFIAIDAVLGGDRSKCDRKKKKKMNLFGYTYKIYDIGYKTEMMSKECNSGDPLETPGGLYRGQPSNENTIFKKMCMPNIKFKSVQCSFTMNGNQLQ